VTQQCRLARDLRDPFPYIRRISRRHAQAAANVS
jgi:hypothetical protein